MSSPSRRWVKVWHEILSDLDFQNLSLEQQARFYHLLVYTSSQGDNGKIEIDTPARFLINLFQCLDYDHLKKCLIDLERVGILVTFCNAKISVSFRHWSKYQIDTTGYERVQKFRNKQIVTPKVTPQEKEKEKEKKKKKKVLTSEEWIAFLKTSSAYSHINLSSELSKMDAWLAANPGRTKSSQFILNWLNKIPAPIQPEKKKLQVSL